MNIYLAAPLFNPMQTVLNENIISSLEAVGHKVWAPQRDGILCPKDASIEERQRIFMMDVEEVYKADCVVAVLDYLGVNIFSIPVPANDREEASDRINESLISDETELISLLNKIINNAKNKIPTSHLRGQLLAKLSHRISLPDSGTIYEMGVAYPQHIPVIGFSQCRSFNLMLTESVVALVSNIQMLVEALKKLDQAIKLGNTPDGLKLLMELKLSGHNMEMEE